LVLLISLSYNELLVKLLYEAPQVPGSPMDMEHLNAAVMSH